MRRKRRRRRRRKMKRRRRRKMKMRRRLQKATRATHQIRRQEPQKGAPRVLILCLRIPE